MPAIANAAPKAARRDHDGHEHELRRPGSAAVSGDAGAHPQLRRSLREPGFMQRSVFLKFPARIL